MSYSFCVTISDEHTGETKYLKAPTRAELEQKVMRQQEIWERRRMRVVAMENVEQLKEEAFEKNEKVQQIITEYNSIINNHAYQAFSADKYYDIQINSLPKFESFTQSPSLESIRRKLNVPPIRYFSEFVSKKKLVKRQSLENEARQIFQKEFEVYTETVAWEKSQYSQWKEVQIQKTNILKDNFYNKDKDQIIKYVSSILSSVTYHQDFRDFLSEFEIDYLPEIDTLIISRQLPSAEILPKFRSFKFVNSKKAVDGVPLKPKEQDSLYESVIFQITLKTIHDVFHVTPKSFVDSIAFNGWIKYIDASNGNDTTACILSLKVDRESFSKINLNRVDYKECIKGLRGLFATKLTSLTPVNPVLSINRTDKRFINSKDVSDLLIDGFNLATMDWSDFEHLIRELFSRIYSSEGGEVRVTQASHDNGIDAIAFIDDPLKGGKFVIQAKRYNILVPVSAVRDLYGAMTNENASRGILVTTSRFGKESIRFADNKPITLIDGQQLLGLMHNYGFDNVTIKLTKQ